jgi:hypothetical protein
MSIFPTYIINGTRKVENNPTFPKMLENVEKQKVEVGRLKSYGLKIMVWFISLF